MRNCLSNTGSTLRNLGIVTYYIVSYDKKSSVSKFVCSIAKYFLLSKFTISFLEVTLKWEYNN
jgi:hypothetical protein